MTAITRSISMDEVSVTAGVVVKSMARLAPHRPT
jgi:hypothetical protein